MSVFSERNIVFLNDSINDRFQNIKILMNYQIQHLSIQISIIKTIFTFKFQIYAAYGTIGDFFFLDQMCVTAKCQNFRRTFTMQIYVCMTFRNHQLSSNKELFGGVRMMVVVFIFYACMLFIFLQHVDTCRCGTLITMM